MARKYKKPFWTRSQYSNPNVQSVLTRYVLVLARAFSNIEKFLIKDLAKLGRDGKIIKSDAKNLAHIRETVESLRDNARKHGFGDVIREQSRSLIRLTRSVLKESGSRKKALSKETSIAVKALMWGLQRHIIAQEGKLTGDLEELLVRSVTGNTKWDDIVEKISDTLDIHEFHARTKAADIISSFHNQVRVKHFEEAGIEWFLYDGPTDTRVRTFCDHFVGTRVTRAILDKHSNAFDRKHPLSASISLGGYNCRHELIPITTEKEMERYPVGPKGRSYKKAKAA